MSETYDVVFIGGGPGGYVGAIKAAQLGLKVACVEGRGALGGTCLNVGCIPSKALLHASHLAHEVEANFAKMGLNAGPVTTDVAKLLGFKQEVIDSNTKGIEFLFKKNKVDYVQGWGVIENAGSVKVKAADGSEKTLATKNVVIATGSESSPLKGVEVDEKRVVTSTGALELTSVPKRLVVIGAGVIGLELGSVWKRLGAEVTVIEFLDHITPGMDGEIQKNFQRSLEKQGIKFLLGAAVSGVDASGADLKVNYTLRKDGSTASLDADVVLLAVGRRPYTAGLGLEAAGVALDERGRVHTDGHGRTNVPGIWAIGDVIAGPMLAHKAEEEGTAVAETLAGQKGHVNYDVIPGVIYTSPEVASVGKTEEQLKQEGRAYKVGKFSFAGNGRAKSMLAAEGFVKVLADANTDRILGVHILGPQAGETIHEYCVAMEFGAAAEDVARTCHAHPTLSEALREAAMAAAFGKPIHS